MADAERDDLARMAQPPPDLPLRSQRKVLKFRPLTRRLSGYEEFSQVSVMQIMSRFP